METCCWENLTQTLEKISQGNRTCITIIDRNLSILWVSSNLQNKGFKLDEIKGRFYQKVFDNKDELDNKDPTYLAIKENKIVDKLKQGSDGETYRIIAFPVKSTDSTEFIIEFSKSLKEIRKDINRSKLFLEDEVQKRTNALNSTIKELVKREAELKIALGKAKDADKLKTQFLSVTSHELRTPITPMKGQLQMLLNKYFGELTSEQEKSLNIVLRNTERLDHLIQDILDTSKLEAGAMKFDMKANSLNELADEVVETMKIKATDRKINLVSITDKIPETIFDSDRIKQVVVNLINNAIKFTNEKGTITLEIKDNKHEAIIKVTDTGIGIPEKDLKRIFNPFEQVDSSRGRNFEGSGLGLAICQGIVETHGGNIGVKSILEKGSCFYFNLPYQTKKEEVASKLFDVHKERALERFKNAWDF